MTSRHIRHSLAGWIGKRTYIEKFAHSGTPFAQNSRPDIFTWTDGKKAIGPAGFKHPLPSQPITKLAQLNSSRLARAISMLSQAHSGLVWDLR